MLNLVILPPSALERLTRNASLITPIMFKVTNKNLHSQRHTHCGVLEFIADEGKCYMPSWVRLLHSVDKTLSNFKT